MPLEIKNETIKALGEVACLQSLALGGQSVCLTEQWGWCHLWWHHRQGARSVGSGVRAQEGSTASPTLQALSQGGAPACFNPAWGRGPFACPRAPGKASQTGDSSWVFQVHRQTSIEILGLLCKNSLEVFWHWTEILYIWSEYLAIELK